MTRSVTASIIWICICTAEVFGQVQLVSVSSTGEQSNADAFGNLSRGGNVVLLRSQATNLAMPDSNGNQWDAFVRDLNTATTVCASVNSVGQQVTTAIFLFARPLQAVM